MQDATRADVLNRLKSLEGHIRGNVSSTDGMLSVSEHGVIEGTVDVPRVELQGQVTGNIAASDKVELKTDCKVVGDIRAPRILIADGAQFKGSIDMQKCGAKAAEPAAGSQQQDG